MKKDELKIAIAKSILERLWTKGQLSDEELAKAKNKVSSKINKQ